MKQSVYLETSVVSYLTSRPSRDLIAYSRQEISREWWGKMRDVFNIYISSVVLEEAARGSSEAAGIRMKFLEPFSILPFSDDVQSRAQILMDHITIPITELPDFLHLAVTSVYTIDYLVTWNCKHLANASIIKRLRKLSSRLDIYIPVICTPEELMEVE